MNFEIVSFRDHAFLLKTTKEMLTNQFYFLHSVILPNDFLIRFLVRFFSHFALLVESVLRCVVLLDNHEKKILAILF